MTTTTALTVAAWPGIQPRLLRHGDEAYAEYRKQGGYHPLDDADHLLGEVDLSGLLGRVGAAVRLSSPTARRASRRRSRTAGCFGTARTWYSTAFGWRPRLSRPSAPT